MSKLPLHSYCSFCCLRFGSTYCLLPHQFITAYYLSNNTEINQQTLDKIHSQYGTGNLLSNFNFVQWFTSCTFNYLGDDEFKFDDQCPLQQTKDYIRHIFTNPLIQYESYDVINDLDQFTDPQITDRSNFNWITNNTNDEVITSYQTIPLLMLPGVKLNTVPLFDLSIISSTHPSTTVAIKDMDTDSLLEQILPDFPTNLMNSDLNLNHRLNRHVSLLEELNISTTSHSLSCLIRTLVTIHFMVHANLTNVKVQHFQTGLRFFSSLKVSSTEDNFKLTRQSLNTPIALARDLVAMHNAQLLLKWKTVQILDCSP